MDNQIMNTDAASPAATMETTVTAPVENGAKPRRGYSQLTYVLAAIVLSIVLVSGMMVYTTNSLNSKLDSINSDIGVIRASLTAGPAVKAQPTVAQPGAAAPSNDPSFKADLKGLTPRGDPNAQVTIVEYSDFQCPFCGRAHPTIDQVLKDYNGKVKLYYKQFPLYQIHQNAQKAAEASLLAADQGRFWEYHDKLFQNQDKLDVDSLKRYAVELGLDTAKFNAGLDSGEKAAQVSADMQEGAANGVQGTPAFFINGKLISGSQPYSVFKQAIDAELSNIG